MQYRADSDIIGMFWKDCIEETQSSTDEMLRSDLYRMYTQYCAANGRKPIKNKGTNGFHNLIAPYLSRVSVVHKAGLYYVQGVNAHLTSIKRLALLGNYDIQLLNIGFIKDPDGTYYNNELGVRVRIVDKRIEVDTSQGKIKATIKELEDAIIGGGFGEF